MDLHKFSPNLVLLKTIAIYTVRGSKNYTVRSSIFQEFPHTIDRELKEIVSKLSKVGSLAAMFVKKMQMN